MGNFKVELKKSAQIPSQEAFIIMYVC